MRRLATLFITVLLFSPPVWAATGQYYLVGYQAPEGSISSAGQGKKLVYLRWDTLEGELPADVVSLRLERNGVAIVADTPVDAVMSAPEIAALYTGPAQERRLLETVKNLKELAVSQGRDFSTGAFAEAIRERLIAPPGTEDAVWAFLASRNDINIARARNRAFVDDPGIGQFAYELLAVDTNGGTARLGYFEIDTAQTQDLLPPEFFMQVLQGQCDAPEMGKDHYTVSLNWESPGRGNVSDRLGAQIYISGYDLYRTSANLDPLATSTPPRNIRAEAASSRFDNRGNPILPGLEKANDVLLTINGDGDVDSEWQQMLGNVNVAGGLVPEWIETQDQLRLAGLKPGDKRGYYLVPRDFTGNYGPTVSTVVVVPNFIRPPAPWELREFIDQTGQLTFPPEIGSAISWDKVNLDNYLDVYKTTRRFCNLPDARASGVLEFVSIDEDCDTDTHRSIRLDVSDYRVYRFETFDEARLFKDSDGDGLGDTRDQLVNGPGAQCTFNNVGVNDGNLVGAGANSLREVALPRTGRKTIRFYDNEPRNNISSVYWYRVASVTPDGRLSLLSAPQRAIYPDRELPPKPIVKMFRPSRVPDGGCEVIVDDPKGPWQFDEQLDGQQFSISCPPHPVDFKVRDVSVADGNRPQCGAIRSACAGRATTLIYPTEKGVSPYSCRVNIPGDLPSEDSEFEFCSQGRGRLVPTYKSEYIEVENGAVLPNPPIVRVEETDPDSCVTLYENIDGVFTKVKTSCNYPEDINAIEYLVESGFFCGYAVQQDSNNNISAAQVTPCVEVTAEAPKAPATPQPVDFEVGGTRVEFSWRLPVEPVAVTLARLDHRPGDGSLDRQVISIPAPGSGSGEVVRHGLDVPALVGAGDEWCISFRAVGPNPVDGESLQSDWSPERCEQRRDDGTTVPKYLPWPQVKAAPQAPDLQLGLLVDLQAVDINIYIDVARIPPTDFTTLLRNCYFPIPPDLNRPPAFPRILCKNPGKAASDAIMSQALDFIVYRQSRRTDGSTGDWIQVSPLIEFAHWDGPVYDSKRGFTRELNDPYIQFRPNTPGGKDLGAISFIDRYPFIIDTEYRYQFIYFSDDHRIARWRETDWVTYSIETLQGSQP